MTLPPLTVTSRDGRASLPGRPPAGHHSNQIAACVSAPAAGAPEGTYGVTLPRHESSPSALAGTTFPASFDRRTSATPGGQPGLTGGLSVVRCGLEPLAAHDRGFPVQSQPHRLPGFLNRSRKAPNNDLASRNQPVASSCSLALPMGWRSKVRHDCGPKRIRHSFRRVLIPTRGRGRITASVVFARLLIETEPRVRFR